MTKVYVKVIHIRITFRICVLLIEAVSNYSKLKIKNTNESTLLKNKFTDNWWLID